MRSKTKDPATKKSAADKQKEQSERFIETARTIGADESGEAFNKAFVKINPPRMKDQK